MKSEEKKRIKWPIIILACVATVLIIVFCIYIKSRTIIRDGERIRGGFRIANTNYVYFGFVTEGRRKKIAEIDHWGVYEVKEDPSQTFLKLKSFTSEEYIVREDYTVPIGGRVNCVYVNSTRISSEKIREAFNEILSTEFGKGTLYYLTYEPEDQERWKHIVLGFEDCPVGTDGTIYGIGKIDNRWMIIFSDEIGVPKGDSVPVIYHELDPKYNEIFDAFENW